jgi:peptidoglycan-N-acetylglucosamine deacetylase
MRGPGAWSWSLAARTAGPARPTLLPPGSSMQLVFYIALGLTAAGSAVMSIPSLILQWADRDAPDVVFAVETAEKVIALSIDDGPSPATAELLEVLAEHGAAATFFVIGEHMEADPATVSRIVAEGHEVGHHMMTDTPSRELDAQAFETRFDQMHRLLEPVAPARLFRPGSGWYDERMLQFAKARGYMTVLGNVYPFDAHVPWTSFTRRFVAQHARPGAILVLHDGPERGPRTAEVLRHVLPELVREGYRIVTVTELLSLGEPRGR